MKFVGTFRFSNDHWPFSMDWPFLRSYQLHKGILKCILNYFFCFLLFPLFFSFFQVLLQILPYFLLCTKKFPPPPGGGEWPEYISLLLKKTPCRSTTNPLGREWFLIFDVVVRTSKNWHFFDVAYTLIQLQLTSTATAIKTSNIRDTDCTDQDLRRRNGELGAKEWKGIHGGKLI